MPYFRLFPEDEDPHRLLDPAEQVSTPWGEGAEGPCDKCSGEEVVPYRCLSCMEQGADPDCPACRGRVEFADICPTCIGTSRITGQRRAGVSVFPSPAGLLRYAVERDVDLDGSLIVELEGRLSDERDLDADEGALLVHPDELLTRHPIDRERVEAMRRRLDDV